MTDAAHNPLLAPTALPDFATIAARHVGPAVDHAVASVRAQLQAAEALGPADWAAILCALETMSDTIGRVWGPVEHLLSVRDDGALRTAHEAAQPQVVEIGMAMAQSRPIYRALLSCKASAAWADVPPVERRAIDLTLREAELAGVGLAGAAAERFNAIQQELAELGTRFGHHLLDATKGWHLDLTDVAEVAGLPETVRQLAAQAWARAQGEGSVASPESGPWRLTLDAPSVVGFLQHSPRRDLRHQVWRAYVRRAAEGDTDNTPVMGQMLRLRREVAALLGDPDYAALSLRSKMAPGVAAVRAMLERLRTASWNPAVRDLDELRALAAEAAAPEAGDLHPWDVAYWTERLREKRYAFNDETVRLYFPLPKVLQGLFDLSRALFGLEIANADGKAPVWHPDVRFFQILDSQGDVKAAFYLDPYSRPADKRSGAWMNECVGRSRLPDPGGRPRVPVAYLVCNTMPPVGDRPALLTFSEVETLLHEFGHGLQHLLTQVDNGLVSGIRGIEWDAVELPSQFMENWCYHRPTLRALSGHVQTGEPIADDLFARIAAARTFRAGSDMLRQLLFATVDLDLHQTFDPDGAESPFDVYRAVAARTSVLPPEPDDRFLCGFSHLFGGGYAAGYYSYKWAEVLSADAFAAFEQAGLDDPAAVAATGQRFAETVLGLGGAVEPGEVFRRFRGRDPDEAALLRHTGLSA
ncbi:MAG: M3 family metallopeptidase [Deltaproteobacteria bacterium]|nr:M3 family metallopeptidase [Deltaproteobacteria bacterium]